VHHKFSPAHHTYELFYFLRLRNTATTIRYGIHRPSIPLLSLSLSLIPSLFTGFPSPMLHYGRTSSLSPLHGLSFFFILGSTPHCTPLAISPLQLHPSFSLNSNILTYILTLFLLYSSGSIPVLTSSQHLLGSSRSIFWVIFPHLYQRHPPVLGGLLGNPIEIHAHQYLPYE
jgi:hypothetical protein